jgi:hypothetical protein
MTQSSDARVRTIATAAVQRVRRGLTDALAFELDVRQSLTLGHLRGLGLSVGVVLAQPREHLVPRSRASVARVTTVR